MLRLGRTSWTGGLDPIGDQIRNAQDHQVGAGQRHGGDDGQVAQLPAPRVGGVAQTALEDVGTELVTEAASSRAWVESTGISYCSLCGDHLPNGPLCRVTRQASLTVHRQQWIYYL